MRPIKTISLWLACALTVYAAQATPKHPRHRLSRQDLALLYTIFVYDGKVNDAFKTAALALKRYPKNKEWLTRYIQAAQWSSHAKEAVEAMVTLYLQTHDAALARQAIELGLRYYRYRAIQPLVRDRMFAEPTNEHIRRFLFVWQQAGDVLEAAQELEKLYEETSVDEALYQALSLYVQAGAMREAQRLAQRMETLHINDKRTLELLAYMRYVSHDIEGAFKTLYKQGRYDRHDMSLLRKISDLGWYMRRTKEAAEASLAIIEHFTKRAEIRDYERVMAAPGIEASRRNRIAIEAWRRFGVAAYVYDRAYGLAEAGAYDALYRLLHDPTLAHTSAYEEKAYWMLVAQAAQATHRPKEALEALRQAYRIAPNDAEVVAMMLWAYIDAHDKNALRRFVADASRMAYDPHIAVALVSAYMELGEIDRAYRVVSSLVRRDKGDAYRMLYAYVLQAQGKEQEAKAVFQEVHDALRDRILRDAGASRRVEVVRDYLQAALYGVGYKRFINLYKRYASVLPVHEREALAAAAALERGDTEAARMHLGKLAEVPLWMRAALALRLKDRDTLQKMLPHLQTLSVYDRSALLQQLGEKRAAYAALFEGAEKNRDHAAYREELHRLAEALVSHYRLQTRWRHRSGADTTVQKLHYEAPLPQEYALRVDGWWEYNRISDTNIFASLPSHTYGASVALTRRFPQKGGVRIEAGMQKLMQRTVSYGVHGWYDLSKRLGVRAAYRRRARAEETNMLWFGGYKNEWALEADWKGWVPWYIHLRVAHADFYGQDDVALGKGEAYSLFMSRTWRAGYPSVEAACFIEAGRYRAYEGVQSTIMKLSPYEDTRVLPENFTTVGVQASWGTQGYDKASSWRSFVHLSPFYNLSTRRASVSFQGGIGRNTPLGDVALECNYTQAVNGTREQVYGCALRFEGRF